MSLLQTLSAFASRRIDALIEPLHERVEQRIQGELTVSKAAQERARGSWWGGNPRWFPEGTPPRQHNRVTPLVDGERFFSALSAAMAGALAYIYVAGWCLTPHIPLARGDDGSLLESRLLTLLNERSTQVPVRILLWSGAFALLQPTRGTMRTVQQTIQSRATGDLQCQLDHRSHFSHCHHQKAIVVDGRIAFVGGMDLTSYQGDRWDLQSHPLRSGPNWHDVQLQIEGEAAADVEQNFRQRWAAVTGDKALPHREPVLDSAWQSPVQIVRTVPRGVYPFARKGEFGIRYTYLEALRKAKRFIYLENQYIWSPEVMDVLTEAINRRQPEPVRIVLVLPARAHSGKWDNDRHIEKLRQADQGRGTVSVYSLYASGPSAGRYPFRYRATYVHAKVGIIDDEWLTVGSANLNNRGLATDTEMNAAVADPELARSLRLDLWAEHLGLPREQVAAADPIELIDRAWKSRAEENAAIMKDGYRPLICSVHRYETGHRPGSWLLDEAEALTLEH